MGAWVSFDGLTDENVVEYAELLQKMKSESLLGNVLISHDAGWYDPSKPNGGEFRGYTTVFTKLIPELKKQGFTNKEINQLLVKNPAKAFAVGVKEDNSKKL
jgi:phosphotriesterase-related protein